MRKDLIYHFGLVLLITGGVILRLSNLLPIQSSTNFLSSLYFFHMAIAGLLGYPEKLRDSLAGLPPHQRRAFQLRMAPCTGVGGLLFLVASFLPDPTAYRLLLGLSIPLLLVMYFIFRFYRRLSKAYSDDPTL